MDRTHTLLLHILFAFTSRSHAERSSKVLHARVRGVCVVVVHFVSDFHIDARRPR